MLTLDELIRRWGGQLEGCDLVTLSACDTNAGARMGESLVSLYWGFFHAGARNALVSLWKVDDHATLLLMDRFYSNWCGHFEGTRSWREQSYSAGQAMPRAAALAEARRWLASSSPEENAALLAELGVELDARQRDRDQGFPAPGAQPIVRPVREAYDYRHPRYWGAFVLYGRAE